MFSKQIFRRPAVMIGLVVAFGAGATAIAQASSPPAPTSPSFAKAAARVEAQGFAILEMDRDHKGFDIEARASDGRRLELDVAADGAILRQRLDD
ncbi:hypothetical protein PMI01_02259 [Caulobacter sp. AP07]|uniref:PepSY domain-containing protein n=1 Tax=Caulobacter sp. AP07 TaxID=1144304 RepID=UPI000272252A|nr:PepSY domain-containing protein [Caulobacter sp. AP07]EJL33296.1 hypothetical protein PMI01_02259 [Caulobacter sp. AP07]